MNDRVVLEIGTGCYHTPPEGYGGTERIIANLAEGLRRSGAIVDILDFSDNGRPSAGATFSLKVPLHIDPRFNELIGSIDSFFFGFSILLNAIDSRLVLSDYDIIHCHNLIVSVFVQIARKLRKIRSKTLIIYSNHSPRLSLTTPLSIPILVLLRSMLVVAARLADMLTFETETARGNAFLVTKGRPTVILPNSIDTSFFSGPRF